MLTIKNSRKSDTPFPLIVSERMDILVDEVPILFTGINSQGNRILGSFVEADYRKGVELYLHAVIDWETYASFTNRKINYPAVLQKAELLYLVFSRAGKKEVLPIQFADLPEIYRPLGSAFCPVLDLPPTTKYPVRLKGKWADLHAAVPEEVAKLQTLIADFFRNPFRRLNVNKLLNVSPVVKMIGGYQSSSFKFDYDISLEKGQDRQIGLFSPDETELSAFLNRYVSYCINDLPDEVEMVLAGGLNDAPRFVELRDAYGELIGETSSAKREQASGRLRDDIVKAVDELGTISDTIGDHYTQVAVSNMSTTGNENPLGTIGQTNKERIENLVSITEARTGRPTTIDEEREYKIFVYDLNTDTRTGRAYLMEDPNDKKAARPKIKIGGTDSLAETKYTESMYKDEYITVRGKATRVGGVPKSIDIVFQP